MFQVIDLFSGIGGFSVAAHAVGWHTSVFCEIMPFPRAVLTKNFPGIPIHGDIRTLTKQKLIEYGWNPNKHTILTGGFPCQPFSVAGKRKGADDDRYLWPEMLRVIQEAKPAWVVGENVGGFATMELDTGIAEMADQEGALVLHKKVAQQVIDDLNAVGYDVPRTDQGDPVLFVIPACAINAPHRRDRIWIVAHRNDNGFDAAKVGQRFQQGNDRGTSRKDKAEQPSRHTFSSSAASENSNGSNNGECEEQRGVGKFGNAGARGYERHTGAADVLDDANTTGARLSQPRQAGERKLPSEGGEGMDNRPEQLCGGNATDSESIFLQGCSFRQREEQSRRGCNENDTNPSSPRFKELHATSEPSRERFSPWMGNAQFDYWRRFPTEPPLHVGDDGLRAELVRLGCRNPDRVIQFQREEAIKGAGNAIVPWVALEIFNAIDFIERNY